MANRFGDVEAQPQGVNRFGDAPPPAQPPVEDAGFWPTIGSDIKNAPTRFMNFISGHPVEETLQAIRDLTQARQQHQQRAAEAYGKGDYKEAFHQLMFSIPIIGPPAGAAADEIQQGKTGEGSAHAVEALAPWIAPELSGEGFARIGAAVENAPGAAMRATGRVLGRTAEAATSPVVRDIAGIVSPRAAHVLSVAGRIKKAVGTIAEEVAPAAEEAAQGYRDSKYTQSPKQFGTSPGQAIGTSPGQALAESKGVTWTDLQPIEQEIYEHAARAQANAAAAPVGPRQTPPSAPAAPAPPAAPGKTIGNLMREEIAARKAAAAEPPVPEQAPPAAPAPAGAAVAATEAPAAAAVATDASEGQALIQQAKDAGVRLLKAHRAGLEAGDRATIDLVRRKIEAKTAKAAAEAPTATTEAAPPTIEIPATEAPPPVTPTEAPAGTMPPQTATMAPAEAEAAFQEQKARIQEGMTAVDPAELARLQAAQLEKLPEGTPPHYQATQLREGTANALRNFGKDQRIANYLQSKGITPEAFETMPLEQQNKLIREAPTASGKGKHKPYVERPAGAGPGPYGRWADEGIQDIIDTMRWQREQAAKTPPQQPPAPAAVVTPEPPQQPPAPAAAAATAAPATPTTDVVARAQENVAKRSQSAEPSPIFTESDPHSFQNLQHALDELDSRAHTMTKREWMDETYYDSPNTLMRWGQESGRPLTRQEARILNQTRESLADQKNFPAVDPGDLPTERQANTLNGFYRGNVKTPGSWRDMRAGEHKALVQQALAEGKPVPPEVLAEYPDLRLDLVRRKIAAKGTP